MGAANLQGKVVSAPQAESAPPRRSIVQFVEEVWVIWTLGSVNLVVLGRLWGRRLKRSSTFSGKKSAPPAEKIHATHMSFGEHRVDHDDVYIFYFCPAPMSSIVSGAIIKKLLL